LRKVNRGRSIEPGDRWGYDKRKFSKGRKEMETKDALFERAARWISTFLEPVFQGLVNDLKKKGYEASISGKTNQFLTLEFSTPDARFEYTIGCMVREGHVDLDCSRRRNNITKPVLFRAVGAVYDIEDVSEGEVKEHFQETFRRWLEK
jgi:hypothetical protein